MILSFTSGGSLVLLSIGKNRELSIASATTSYAFLRVEKLKDLRRDKSFSKSELLALDGTIRVVKGFKTVDEVKAYVVVEMEKLGLVFGKELSVDDYKKAMGIV